MFSLVLQDDDWPPRVPTCPSIDLLSRFVKCSDDLISYYVMNLYRCIIDTVCKCNSVLWMKSVSDTKSAHNADLSTKHFMDSQSRSQKKRCSLVPGKS